MTDPIQQFRETLADRIHQALEFVDAGDRATWLRMGMAIKSELADTGFDVWEAWSQQADSFDSKDARDVWKSIRVGGKVTIGTLFYEARLNGWRDEGTHHKLTPEELTERRRIAAERKAKEDTEEARRKHEAQKRATLIWAEAYPCSNHGYLTRKGIAANGVKLIVADKARQEVPDLSAELTGELLVIPMRDTAGVTHSLQFITGDGVKRPLTGGRKRGCYFSIGKPDKVLCIAEGFATGASIHQASSHAVAVAFDAGNMLSVAKALREKYPDLLLILCADDDYRTKGNPGVAKAREAAQAIGGKVAIPDFGHDRPEAATDFNDLHQAQGLEAVARCIEAAINPSETDPINDADKAESLPEQITRLSELPQLEYEQIREKEAKRLGIRVGILDQEIASKRKSKEEENSHHTLFPAITPWPEPVQGEVLLNEIYQTLKRFIICDDETAIAASLWIIFTWLIDSVQVAPLAIITAPEKRCGKSQFLNLIGQLSYRPLIASNVSAAAVYRVIEAHSPTLLIDEADTFMNENEDLRGIINSGHTRQSAYTLRCVGDEHEIKQFSTWGAKAISGIGRLSDTLMDRAVILTLRRKLQEENVSRLRHAEPDLFKTLNAKLARFAQDAASEIKRARPELPETLNDRAQDNWEPLLAIADLAGGNWPQAARSAAIKISGTDQEATSISTELLQDIQEFIETEKVIRFSLTELIEWLCKDEEKPWAGYNRGKQITPRQVSRRLKEYGLETKTIRIGYQTHKGYEASDFKEIFARYIPLTHPEKSGNTVTNQPKSINHAAFSVTKGKNALVTNEDSGNKSHSDGSKTSDPKPFNADAQNGQNVTDGGSVTVTENAESHAKPYQSRDVTCYRENQGGAGGIYEVTI